MNNVQKRTIKNDITHAVTKDQQVMLLWSVNLVD